MEKLNRKSTGLDNRLPIKVVQFGEGNFLRAFVDYAFQRLNNEVDFNAGIAVVQPLKEGMVNLINDQDGLYTLFMNGIKKGEKIQDIQLISNIVKAINPYSDFADYLALAKEEELQFIVSNTTEAGIEFLDSDTPDMQPPAAFPAKLTVLLLERFKHFNGATSKAVTIIPCELIDYNAETLKKCILQYCDLWNLDAAFVKWVSEDCTYHSTLVDRIVPGYPRAEIEEYNSKLAYQDSLIVAAEPFFLWAIEGGADLKAKLPFDKTDLNVKIVDDIRPFKMIKVRILNGAHTAMVPVSLLFGNELVMETVNGDFTGPFVDKVIAEISETLPMDKNEITAYAEEVMDRFRNPFIKHALADIALNSISKFKVRVLPSLLGYYSITKKLPTSLTFSLACLIQFYKGTWNNEALPVKDTPELVEALKKAWELVNKESVVAAVLANTDFWDEDLNKVEGLSQALVQALNEIEANGIQQGFENFSK
ncbi:altronate oxidoreductase [Flavobacterium branchiophilum]|uniref:Tagaturonate reductase n=1 Tax=Flavobacterium branchiophilum TaxID=55197 RepID=A0A543G1N1_9FLAO|nr:tagaturonate reductase [Flavobacterium branchiophilum]OXA74982.1 altronate oxidoreductase [Flavobacterium branchiophilum] [Flavobacterium branchiophilum NBRC 15030 = ATCC 35035]TQM39996.1 tagaturonate reductase [Flavobacterium branchiophilum]GEM55366.1 altronate oxidoreductase [Flavobacterium branchiophilum NBRC 15030 = ATCC 35035]